MFFFCAQGVKQTTVCAIAPFRLVPFLSLQHLLFHFVHCIDRQTFRPLDLRVDFLRPVLDRAPAFFHSGGISSSYLCTPTPRVTRPRPTASAAPVPEAPFQISLNAPDPPSPSALPKARFRAPVEAASSPPPSPDQQHLCGPHPRNLSLSQPSSPPKPRSALSVCRVPPSQNRRAAHHNQRSGEPSPTKHQAEPRREQLGSYIIALRVPRERGTEQSWW